MKWNLRSRGQEGLGKVLKKTALDQGLENMYGAAMGPKWGRRRIRRLSKTYQWEKGDNCRVERSNQDSSDTFLRKGKIENKR
jgi:hypothetical protein